MMRPLPGPLHTGKVRRLFPVPIWRDDIHDVYRLDDHQLLIVMADFLNLPLARLLHEFPGRGVILAAMVRFWATVPGIRTNVVAEAPLPSWADSLASRALVVNEPTTMHLVEWVVASHLVGPWLAEYVRHGTINGQSMPPGLLPYQPLPELLVVPTVPHLTAGYDVAITDGAAVELMGDKTEAARSLCVDAYRAAATYASDRGVTLLDTVFAVGEVDGEMALVGDTFTPVMSRMALTEKLDPRNPPPDEEGMLLRWARKVQPQPGQEWPPVPGWLVRAVNHNLRTLCQQLAGSCPT